MCSAVSSVRAICAALSEIRGRPFVRARAMPSAFYTAPDFLEIEKNHIFLHDWVCVGHAGEITHPGEYFTTELIDEPLVVIRGADGQVRVFSNVCRHRGNLIAMGKGKGAYLTCGYHGWTYAPNGALVSARLMDRVEDFDKAGVRLPSFRTEIWQNFIFVNLDDNATPLAPRLTGLMPHIANYHQEERQLLHTAEVTWRTNWKCVVENFMEGYHIDTTHPKSIGPYFRTALSEKVEGSDAFTAYKAHYRPSAPQRGKHHPDLDPEQRRTSFLFCIFPSFVASFAPDIAIYFCVRPGGIDEARLRWGITAHEIGADHPSAKDYIAFCDTLNIEDRTKLEAQQYGLRSRFYTPGRLAPNNYEGAIWDLYQFVGQRLADLR
jgi:phenylpropionate dioxygenase-like ring-hydroxylating dioxygenase large terminal subunit